MSPWWSLCRPTLYSSHARWSYRRRLGSLLLWACSMCDDDLLFERNYFPLFADYTKKRRQMTRHNNNYPNWRTSQHIDGGHYMEEEEEQQQHARSGFVILEVGGEYHYLFCCPFFPQQGKILYLIYIVNVLNALKCEQLFFTSNKRILQKLVNFVNVVR